MNLRRDLLFCMALAAAVALCYSPGLKGPPVYDDLVGILHNPKMTRPDLLARGFLDPTPQVPLGVPFPSIIYRPLTEASFAVNLALGGGLTGLRVGNMLLHAGAACLIFLIALRLGDGLGIDPRPFARWASLFFALHPLGGQVVTYAYQRFTLLAATLGFLSVLLYLSARAEASPFSSPRYWGALGAALLASLAKETAVTLPLTLAAIAWILREPGTDWRGALRRWLPFALLPVLVLVQVLRISPAHRAMAGQGLDFTGPEYGFNAWEYLLLQLPIVLRYLTLNFLPFPLHFYYDRVVPLPWQPAGIPVLPTALCALGLLTLMAWSLFGPSRHRLPRLAVALFLAPLALESSVFPIMDIAFNHRCYPGLLGAGLLAAWGLGRLGRAQMAGGAAVMALFAGLLLFENRAWADPLVLQRRDIRHAPHLSTVWGNYGWRRFQEGRTERAERIFRHALHASWADVRNSTGHVQSLIALGRLAEARQENLRTLEVFPNHTSPLWVSVQLAEREGDPEALDALDKRIEALKVLRPDMLVWLAQRWRKQGRVLDAERLLLRHLDYFPAYPQLWIELGHLAQAAGRMEEADLDFRRAAELDAEAPRP
jgi:Tfp pilus assembly protein PilF